MKKKDKDMVKVIPKKKKHIGLIIIIVVIAVFFILRGVIKAMTPQNMAVVSTAVAIMGDIEESVTTSGTIVSEEQKVYYASINATVGEVPFSVGDVVNAGDYLLTYNMNEMEKELTKAYLQLEASNSSYHGSLQGNTTNQTKLAEANTNLTILNQQIADNEVLLKELQTKLATMQREESTALANKILELQTKATQLESLITEAMSKGEDTTDLKEQLQANTIEMSRTSTAQQTLGSADAYVKLEKEITATQEQIANYEKYKAEMETQKATTENSVLDSYQKDEISANNQLAQLTFDDMADTYNRSEERRVGKECRQ